MKNVNTSANILIIYTGGTIGMIENRHTGALETYDFTHVRRWIPELEDFDYNIQSYAFNPPIDSSDMEPSNWQAIVKVIADNYDNYDGFVVLHGTDTMSYTASALSFMLQGLTKPVILTGSQLPISMIRTDGRENLLTSIEIAAAKDTEGNAMVPEVCIFFENRLLRGNRTTKINAEGFNAFRSFNFPWLAHAGIHIKYNEAVIRRPKKDNVFKPHYVMDSNVVVITLFPGIRREIISSIVNIPGLRAVVLRTYGSGNAPQKKWLIELLKEAEERGIIVVNVTQCSEGWIEMNRYRTGLQLLETGVVNGHDATVESTITKLMFLVGHNLSNDRIRELMNTDLRGEITIR